MILSRFRRSEAASGSIVVGYRGLAGTGPATLRQRRLSPQIGIRGRSTQHSLTRHAQSLGPAGMGTWSSIRALSARPHTCAPPGGRPRSGSRPARFGPPSAPSAPRRCRARWQGQVPPRPEWYARPYHATLCRRPAAGRLPGYRRTHQSPTARRCPPRVRRHRHRAVSRRLVDRVGQQIGQDASHRVPVHLDRQRIHHIADEPHAVLAGKQRPRPRARRPPGRRPTWGRARAAAHPPEYGRVGTRSPTMALSRSTSVRIRA